MKRLKIPKGRRFGMLIYTKEAPRLLLPSGQKPRVAFCKCDCGNTTKVLFSHLRHGKITSCGCKHKAKKRSSVVGLQCGTLVIIEELEDLIINDRVFRNIKAKCTCGKIGVWRLNTVKAMKSCGCLTSKIISDRFTDHGLTKHPLFRTWQNMKNRCFNKNVESYKYYGAKGVKVCDEWKHDYKAFYDWSISNGYEKSLTIDRYPDKGGDYSPSNCRWATDKQQQNNKSTNVFYTYKGETKTLAEFAEQYGFKYSRANTRIKKLKWSIEAAIEEQVIPALVSLKKDYIPKTKNIK